MPPPRRRTRGALSTYDREMLQAIADRRLDPTDPDAQAVLQRVNAQTAVTPPRQRNVTDYFDPLGTIARTVEENVFAPAATALSEASRPAVEAITPLAGAAVRGLGAEVSLNPQDWPTTTNRLEQYQEPYRGPIGTSPPDEGRPPVGPTTTAGQTLSALGAVLPWAYSRGSDLITGEDHGTPAPNIFTEGEQPTFESVFEAHGHPEGVQAIGSIADLVADPIDLAFPMVGAGMGIIGTGLKAAQKASTLIPPALRGLEKVLDPTDWNTFRRAVERSPDAKRPLSMLLPSEVGPLTRSVGGVTRFADTYNRLPDANYLAAAIRRGAPKRGWYANSRQALTEILGDDADMFTGLLAAMSPQTSVESNLTNALNTFVNWRAAGRPRGEQEIKDILGRSVQGGTDKSVLTAWTPNSVRVLQGGQSVSGPKIDQFWLALRDRALNTKAGAMDTQEAMVLDAWMANLMGADQKLWSGNLNKENVAARLAEGDPGATPAYLAGVARMREAAKKAGVEGAEAQEMAWSTAMALYEQASAQGISAREVLQRGLLTDEVVAGTPDFATLLRDPEFASILGRDPELSARLSSSTRTPRAAPDPMPMDAADQRHLLRVADTLDELRAMRLTDTAVKTGRMPEDTLAGVVAAEAVTDAQHSAFLPHGSTPEGTRIHRSPRIFGAGETLREQQGVMDAALGPGTGSRFRGTGSYIDDAGIRQENPLSSYGFRGREIKRGGGLPVDMERRLRAARNIIAGGTGQSTAAHVVINPGVPRARHNAATIYAGRDLGRPAISAFAADLRALNVAGSFVPVHSANSVRVLRLGDDFLPTPLSASDEASVRQLAARHFGTEDAKGQMSAPRMETGENVAKRGYEEIAQGAEAGSGERVARMVGAHDEARYSDWKMLDRAVQRRMDTAVKAWATRLLNIYDMPRIRRERPDEARMLEILASTGASGLAKARESGVVLPALAALGFHLTPSGASGTVPQGEES
jgi:hypothetical protein